tara:strand:- start:194 stop:295 length:102 start_codon:yes stop_codon:yes gene_type:complete
MTWVAFLCGIWIGVFVGFFLALLLRNLPDEEIE